MIQNGTSSDAGVNWLVQNGLEVNRQNWAEITHIDGLPDDWTEEDWPEELRAGYVPETPTMKAVQRRAATEPEPSANVRDGDKKTRLVVNRNNDKLIDSIDIVSD